MIGVQQLLERYNNMDKITKFIRFMDRRVKFIPLNFTVIQCLWGTLFLFIFLYEPYYNLTTIIIYGIGCLYLGIRYNFGGE